MSCTRSCRGAHPGRRLTPPQPVGSLPGVRLLSTQSARRLTAALMPAVIASLFAGCGSSHSSGTVADPASATPAAAPLYAGAIVRPGEPLKGAARSAGTALTHQADPYLVLLGALQTPGSGKLDYQTEVAPWLGEQAGIFLAALDASAEARLGQLLALLAQGRSGSSSGASAFPFAAHGAQGAIVLDTSDVAKARSFLDAQAKRAGAHAASYRGVSYQVSSDGTSFGIVDRFAVIGSESGLHSVVDTTFGAPSLEHSAAYAKLLGSAPSGVLAHLYANSGSLLSAARGAGANGFSAVLSPLSGSGPVNVSLTPSSSSFAIDADALPPSTPGAPRGLFASAGEGAQAFGELPGESWLGLGVGDAGATLPAVVGGVQALASFVGSLASGSAEAQRSAGLSASGLLKGLLLPLSALTSSSEAARSFRVWAGPAGLFASGSGLLELKAASVINSKSPALSRAAVAQLGAALRRSGASVQATSIPGTDAAVSAKVAGLPVVLDIANGRAANGQTKFVIGLGEASVTAVLSSSSPLSGAASTSAAASALGEGIRPSVVVDFPTLLTLLEGVGLNEDPTISALLPYLRSLTTLSGGGKPLGNGVERFRLVLGLRSGG
jgi:Protein of unknown function (DUF3352)